MEDSINRRYIVLLKEIFDNSKASIKTDIGTTRFVKILKGVKQGDLLCFIFLYCGEAISVLLKLNNQVSPLVDVYCSSYAVTQTILFLSSLTLMFPKQRL